MRRHSRTPPELRRKSENCKIRAKNQRNATKRETRNNNKRERKRQRQQEQDPQQQKKGRPAGNGSSQGNTGEHADQTQRQHGTQRARKSTTSTRATPQHNATLPDATKAQARAKPATQAPTASRPTHQPQASPTPPEDHLACVNRSEIPSCATQQIRFWHLVIPPPTALLAAWFSSGVLLIRHLLRCPGSLVLLRQPVIPPPCFSQLTQFARGF